MKSIRKIQPKGTDIDIDFLAQRIREGNRKMAGEEIAEPTINVIKPKTVAKAKIQTITEPEPVAAVPRKKGGRKKTNTDTMHRFAIDLPEWLFDKIRQDADTNFSTVRGQILKLLLVHYKN